MIATRLRRYADRGHQPPATRVDHTGAPWLGAARVLDRPARRRANRRTWRWMQAEARREFVASKGASEVTAPTKHLQTGSSTVRCGAPMRDAQHPEGWDLGTVTVDAGGATCPDCLAAIHRNVKRVKLVAR